jgi:hypothetical protein
MTIALFAYGSLVSPASFERTLGRRPRAARPARLAGWRRSWSIVRDNLAAEKTFSRQDGGEVPRWIVGLNLEPAAADDPGPNGALIEIGEAELARLDIRELRYDRIEVGDRIAGDSSFDRVVAYTAKPDHFRPEVPDEAVAMAPYLRTIEAAFRAFGDDQWELFLETTGPPPAELIEPVLVRDEIPPGNPREW